MVLGEWRPLPGHRAHVEALCGAARADEGRGTIRSRRFVALRDLDPGAQFRKPGDSLGAISMPIRRMPGRSMSSTCRLRAGRPDSTTT